MITDIYFTVTSAVHGMAHHLSGGDPMAKGLISIALLGALVAALRREPMRIYSFLRTRFSSFLNLMYVGSDSEQEELHNAISAYVMRKVHKRIYRGERDNDRLLITQGSGTFWFFDNRTLVLFSRSRETKDKVETNTITMRTFGKNVGEYVASIPDVQQLLTKGKDKRYFKFFTNGYPQKWRNCGEMGVSPELIIPFALKKKIDDAIHFFVNNKQWYADRGLAYKLSFMFYGPPGTGKTSLSRYVADKLNWSLAGCVDERRELIQSFRMNAGTKTVISVQDVETHWGIAPRLEAGDTPTPRRDDGSEDDRPQASSRDLGRWLDVLQGDIPLNDQVVIFTTNHLDKIDPAFYRPGRVDLCAYVGNFAYDEANRFFKAYYETSDELGEEFKDLDLSAAQVSSSFTNNPRSSDGFKYALKELMENAHAVA